MLQGWGFSEPSCGKYCCIFTEIQSKLFDKYNNSSGKVDVNIFVILGRGGYTKTRENPGIAKKGGGGLTPAKKFLVDLS